MRLFSSPTSPFCRKVLACALARSIPIEELFVDLRTAHFYQINPLGQIPALQTDEGDTLFDSDVIVQYLDTCHHGPLLIGGDRFSSMTRIHLANGMMEAVLQRLLELRRPEEQRHQATLDHLEQRVARVLTALEKTAPDAPGASLSAVDIATMCALEYVDFRYPHDWRAQHEALAAWHKSLCEREPFARTRPTRTAPVVQPTRAI